MLHLKTKKELAQEAYTLAKSYSMVRYRSTIYIPADFETRETSVTPPPERTIWLPLVRDDIRALAADQFETLFGTDSELSAFEFMVGQSCIQHSRPATSLLVKTEKRLQMLDHTGALVDVDGLFHPNAIVPMLNEDPAAKQQVFDVISGWLNSEEEAESLLRHLATSLAPAWSAVKYVLFLGEGRNGKSLMLKMLEHLFGRENVSHVSRQAIAENSAVVTELNGKLLNIVYDGRAEYVKDSGNEKSLVAGEMVSIRRLYESVGTPVQTTALFIEGLQKEPKTGDKSTALQKRLVRFQFPNFYDLDHRFERTMLHENQLGALLSLLIDRYIQEDDVARQLMPTTRSLELQLEQMYANSLGLQFLKYLHESANLGLQEILGEPVEKLVTLFHSWRLKENDLSTWAEPDVLAQFAPLLSTERKSVRVAGKPRKIRTITGLKLEAAAFIDTLKGEDADAALLDALVDD